MKTLNHKFLNISFSVLAIVLIGLAASASAAGNSLDSSVIEKITGLKGAFSPEENVFKVAKPRTDITVSVDGWKTPPFMGLTSWAAFAPGMKSEAMVMGDLVLFQDEVNPVMSVLLDHGLAVTALHNHFFFDEPKVYFMHMVGEGSAAELAKGVRAALDKSAEIRKARPAPGQSFGGAALPDKSSITGAAIEKIIGRQGETKDGMFKITIGRTVKMQSGDSAGKQMGVNTWAAFAGSDDNAVVDGDFAVLEGELQPVLGTLRKYDINIVAIHHHMSGEKPRQLFLHYWGRGKASNLALAVKKALEQQK